MSIPLLVVLNSRMEDVSGVMDVLLIPMDWACIVLLVKLTINNRITDAERFLNLMLNIELTVLFFMILCTKFSKIVFRR